MADNACNHFIARGIKSPTHAVTTPPPVYPINSAAVPDAEPNGPATNASPPSTAEPTTTTTAFRLAVKDNIATRALATTCGSAMLRGYASPIEATVVAQLAARGARLVGKTNLDEFGMGSHSANSAFGAVANAWGVKSGGGGPPMEGTNSGADDDGGVRYSAGGSSGGSAAAVALGDADVALGTDTGGSVRLPAAYGGVVGYKPSHGMLSRHGVVAYANSLDTVGLLARDVGPIQRLMMAGGGAGPTEPRAAAAYAPLWREHDPKDPTSLSAPTRARCAAAREGYGEGVLGGVSYVPRPESLTFGLPVEYNIAELDPAVRAAWARAADVVQRELGARVVPVSLPSTRLALAAYYVLAPAEASSNLARYDGVRYGGRQHLPELEEVGGADAATSNGGGTTDANDKDHDHDRDVLYARVRGALLGPEVRRRILLGSYTLSASARDNYFVRAQRARRLVRHHFDGVFKLSNPLVPESEQHGGAKTTEEGGAGGAGVAEGAGWGSEAPRFDLSDLHEAVPLDDKLGPPVVDFLLCPTAPTLPPTLREVRAQTPVEAYMNDVFTVPASLAGLPAISVPVKLAGGGGRGADSPFPFAGLQIIGQFFDDARLLAVARMLHDNESIGFKME